MKLKCLLSLLVVTQLSVLASPPPEEGFVAHEWGTFTSVQGADGIQLEWNPLVITELPEFVYDFSRNTPNSRARRAVDIAGKSAFVTLQRMETPVVYFYTDKARTVDVTVKFPQGRITEWFPQVATLTGSLPDQQVAKQNGVRWSNVQVLPGSETQAKTALMPVDKTGSHYYAARNTEANLIKVQANSGLKPEYDKFLFYRGVGNFTAPLRVTMSANEDMITMENTGAELLEDLYVLQVQSGMGKFMYIKRLPPGKSESVRLQPGKNLLTLSELQARISRELADSLGKKGLYMPEAKAMVATWRDSWFGEEGTRVLYTLPREWTERTLPLEIKPRPSEIVRVMVGRAEVLPPSKEWQLLKQIVRFSEQDAAGRAQAVEATRKLGLGRFTEPAVRHLSKRIPGQEFSQHAWNLLDLTRPEPTPGKPFAQK
jgi:hypothetical protein